jgi:hypothetical protein
VSRGGDRRPWLILSRSEAIALQAAALASLERPRGLTAPPEALARALRMVDLQLRYIDEGAADGLAPTVEGALAREQHG